MHLPIHCHNPQKVMANQNQLETGNHQNFQHINWVDHHNGEYRHNSRN